MFSLALVLTSLVTFCSSGSLLIKPPRLSDCYQVVVFVFGFGPPHIGGFKSKCPPRTGPVCGPKSKKRRESRAVSRHRGVAAAVEGAVGELLGVAGGVGGVLGGGGALSCVVWVVSRHCWFVADRHENWQTDIEFTLWSAHVLALSAAGKMSRFLYFHLRLVAEILNSNYFEF
jgi:hypothetical protein